MFWKKVDFCRLLVYNTSYNTDDWGMGMEDKKDVTRSDAYIFVDESGSITKDSKGDKYFVICLIITKDKKKLERAFRNENIALAKRYPSLGKMLKENKEIKGSDITEPRKSILYENMIKKYHDLFEIGIIILDNENSTTQLSLVKARCFNFLIQEYMGNYFRHHCKFFDRMTSLCQNINFTIDERNVKTNAKHRLDGYLTEHLNAFDPICTDSINVAYTDSKNALLVQFADYIANTFYRNMKRIKESNKNVKMLQENLCDNRVFVFPLGHDIHIDTECDAKDE